MIKFKKYKWHLIDCCQNLHLMSGIKHIILLARQTFSFESFEIRCNLLKTAQKKKKKVFLLITIYFNPKILIPTKGR